jgi:cytochrome P450
VLALAEHPVQRGVLAADPAGTPAAVEECLRWVTPVQAFGRTATSDTQLGGQPIAEGDFVVMLYASANRDEAVFGPTADRFDVTRPVDTTHLAFGFGEHLCLGAALARLETRVMLEELLARQPTYDVVASPTWTRSTLVRGISSLPVRFA